MDSLNPALTNADLNALPALTLAQVGDAVFELMVRTSLCRDAKTAKTLHSRRVSIVSAAAQGRAAALIIPVLTPEETAVFIRGRNTRLTHVPSSATRAQYQTATALETLFGWLWLGGRRRRLEELFGLCVPAQEP